jgi:hypothetical protein
MKTCTVCGRRAADDATECVFDGGALEERADETTVRARPAGPVGPPRFTVEDLARPATPLPNRSSAPPPPVERSLWPATIAIAVAATIGVGAFMYYLFSQRSREVDSINAQISDARIAIADAKARIESLPLENPLRQKIISLDKWDRELQGFQLSSDRSSEMGARARDILIQAEQISDQARSAGATMAVKPVVPPPTPAPEVPAPTDQPSATPVQPPAPTDPTNENAKPPAGSETPGSSPEGGKGTTAPSNTNSPDAIGWAAAATTFAFATTSFERQQAALRQHEQDRTVMAAPECRPV